MVTCSDNFFYFSFYVDEAVLGRGSNKPENTLLGTRYGRMAASPEHTTIKMVLNGQRPGRHERIRSRHVNIKHAYSHV